MVAMGCRANADDGRFGSFGSSRADEGSFGSFGPGRAANGSFRPARAGKLVYVKPLLATHGAVAELTLGGHKSDPYSHDAGSNIQFRPGPIDGKLFGW